MSAPPIRICATPDCGQGTIDVVCIDCRNKTLRTAIVRNEATTPAEQIADESMRQLAEKWAEHRRTKPFYLTVHAAPRTKKNGTTLGIKQSPQYSRFRRAVQETVDELADTRRPILPTDIAYNLCATFYVDKSGERADLFGLLQAIADALQDAGVIADDWQFRTCDGSRIVIGEARPRVEVTIEPLRDA